MTGPSLKPAASDTHTAWFLTAFLALFLGAQLLGNALYFDPKHVATIWPSTGLFMAGLLLLPSRRWLPLIAVAWVGQAISDLWIHERGLGLHLWYASANIVESVVGAGLLRWCCRGGVRLSHLRDVVLLILFGALLSTTAGAVLGAMTVTRYFAGAAFDSVWQVWWFADATGALLVAPFFLSLAQPGQRRRGSRLESGILIGLLVLILWVVFAQPAGVAHSVFDQPFMLLPLFIWATTRLSTRLSLGLLAGCGLVIASLADHGLGPFRAGGFDTHETVLRLQSFLAVLSCTVLALHALVCRERWTHEALAQSEQHYHSLAALSPVGIARLDADGTCTYVNERFAELSGSSPPDCMGRGWLRALGADAPEAETSLLQQVLDLTPFEHEMVVAPGTSRWFIIQACGAPGGEELVLGLLDISQRRDLEEQLQHAQKMEAVGRLAGGIAHDFNNLLTAIIGYAELIGDQVEPGGRVHAGLDEIRGAGLRAAALTQQLLAFSRKQSLKTEQIDLVQLVQNASNLLERTIGAPIRLELNLETTPLPLHCVPDQIEQILFNLVINARDALRSRGTITVWVCRRSFATPLQCLDGELPAGDYAELSVEDEGSGIPPELLGKIFDPFFTTKPVGEGTGLGLATVYGITAQHGGGIQVDSVPDQGTTFKVFLPLSPRPIPAEAASVEPESEPRAAILVVEDESSIRALVESVLQSLGYAVEGVSSAEEALASVRRRRPDLVLTDIVMPDVNGLALAGQLQEIAPALPILFMSGYAQDLDAAERIGDQSLPFIQKPFRREQLARQVGALLAAARGEASTRPGRENPGLS